MRVSYKGEVGQGPRDGKNLLKRPELRDGSHDVGVRDLTTRES